MEIDVGDFRVEYGDSGVLQVYDSHNNCIHSINSSGFEVWSEYDKNNNCMYYKDSTGMEEWAEIDNNGNSIHNKNSNGFEEWYYYEGNNCIHSINSDGYESWSEYHPNGTICNFKNSAGMKSWCNSKGNQITKEEFDELYETKTIYVLRKSEADGSSTEQSSYIHPQPIVKSTDDYYKYDSSGNIFYIKNHNGETWRKFCGTTLVHSLHSWGEENWYAPNGKIIFKEEFDKIYDTQFVLRK